ncbi:MAG: WecB/TagA/CpsF family glycosyltransferase [Cyanobacteria bacterium P01_H01_bin.35]
MTNQSDPLLTPPSKTNLLGMGVSRTNYQECTDFIIQSAQLGKSCTVAPTPVHGIMTGYLDPKDHGYRLNHFTIVAPDGQPVRWAINLLRKSGDDYLSDRVYGPTLMLHLCERAAREDISIFLYGSTPKVVENLQLNLNKKFPNLKFAGAISPPFRSLTKEEDAEYIKQIRESGAGIIFIGLGCPRQEKWAFEHSDRLNCALVCVGAAFNFHAGNVPQAPPWMQKVGLEWFFRFLQEPNRLWKRYLLLNPLYLILLFLQLIKLLPKRDFSQQ